MGLIWGATYGGLSLSYPVLAIAAFTFANSNAFIDTVSVSTNVSNWPNDRGSAVGVMKAAVGLSSSVYGVASGALRLNTSSFLLLMMIGPAVGCIMVLPLINIVPWIQKCELQPHGLLRTASRFFMAYQVQFPLTVCAQAAHNDDRACRPAVTLRDDCHMLVAESRLRAHCQSTGWS